MDEPPAALFTSNPVAYHLALEVRAQQLTDFTRAQAGELTGAGRAALAAAINALLDLDLIEPAQRGHYRPRRRCRVCQVKLHGKQTLYCSKAHALDWHHQQTAAEHAAERAAEDRRCTVCGKALEPKPRARHQKYCSRHCEYVATGR